MGDLCISRLVAPQGPLEAGLMALIVAIHHVRVLRLAAAKAMTGPVIQFAPLAMKEASTKASSEERLTL